MPLIKSSSDKARSANIATEIKSGKNPKQAAAIGYSVQRQAATHHAEYGDVAGLHMDGRPLIETPHGPIPVPLHSLDSEQLAAYARLLHEKAHGPTITSGNHPKVQSESQYLNSIPIRPGQPTVQSDFDNPPPNEATEQLDKLGAAVNNPQKYGYEPEDVGGLKQAYQNYLAKHYNEIPGREMSSMPGYQVKTIEPSPGPQGNAQEQAFNLTRAQGTSGGDLPLSSHFGRGISVNPSGELRTPPPAQPEAQPQGPVRGGILGVLPGLAEGGEVESMVGQMAKGSSNPPGQGELLNDALASVGASPDEAKLAYAIRHHESGDNPNAVSPTGVTGEYQYTKSTAAGGGFAPHGKPFDPQNRVEASKHFATDIKYLSDKFGGDPDKVWAAWNSGVSAVKAAEALAKQHGGDWHDFVYHSEDDPLQTQKGFKNFHKSLQAFNNIKADAAASPGGQPEGSNPPGMLGQNINVSPEEANQYFAQSEANLPTTTEPAATPSFRISPGAAAAMQAGSTSGYEGAEAGPQEPQANVPSGEGPQQTIAEADANPQPSFAQLYPQFNPASQSAPELAQTPQAPQIPGVGPEEASSTVASGLESQKQHLMEQANAEAQGQQETATELGAQAQQNQGIYNSAVALEQELRAKVIAQQQRAQAVIDQVANDKINPDRWWSSKPIAAKIGSLLGIAVSSLSGTNTNAVVESLKDEAARDMKAQEANLLNRRGLASEQTSLLGKMLDVYQSVPAAVQAGQAALLRAQAEKLLAIAAKSNDPILRAKIAQLVDGVTQSGVNLQNNATILARQNHEEGLFDSAHQKITSGRPDLLSDPERGAAIRGYGKTNNLDTVNGQLVYSSKPKTPDEHAKLAAGDEVVLGVRQLSQIAGSVGNRENAQAQFLGVKGALKAMGVAEKDIDDTLNYAPTTPGYPWSGVAQGLLQLANNQARAINGQRLQVPLAPTDNTPGPVFQKLKP